MHFVNFLLTGLSSLQRSWEGFGFVIFPWDQGAMYSKQPDYSTENSFGFPFLAARLPVTSQSEVTSRHSAGSLLSVKRRRNAGDGHK